MAYQRNQLTVQPYLEYSSLAMQSRLALHSATEHGFKNSSADEPAVILRKVRHPWNFSSSTPRRPQTPHAARSSERYVSRIALRVPLITRQPFRLQKIVLH